MCLFIGEELKASSKGLSELAVTVCHCFQVQCVTEILSFVGELASLLEYCLSFQVACIFTHKYFGGITARTLTVSLAV